MSWFWIIIVLIGLVFFVATAEIQDEPVADCSAASADACAEPVEASDSGGVWRQITIGEIDGVILPASDADRLAAGLFADGPTEFWTPEIADIEAAEAEIARAEGELGHMRQYAGFVQDGERKIVVNGFCDDHGLDWRTTDIVGVDDGGDCYFTAIYNVETDALERFLFNGLG